MQLLLPVVGLVAVVAVTSTLARRLGLLAPLLLLVVGTVLSLVPGVPEYRLDPQLVLVGILPLLLYVAALRTSVPDFRANLRPIALLAVGLVLATAVGVGLVLHLVVPSIPLAAAVALGAVVAPPDAIAATSLARRVGLPRRVVTILEGESLINDATALVLLRVAVAASVGAALSWGSIALEVVQASALGIGVGVLVGLLAARLHRLTDEPLLDNTISLLTPFVAFIPAEMLHASGVVAVVVCGLYIGHHESTLMSAASRLQMSAVWAVVEFLLQGAVFVLVGLQLRGVLTELVTPWPVVAAASVAVLGTVVLVRFAWMYPATYLARLVPRVRERDPAPPASVPTVIAWAGMRGVVTMAAAVSLPFFRENGSPYPGRDLMVWLAFVVVVGTLLGQGTTLTALVRRLRVPADDPTEDALAAATARQESVRAGEARLQELLAGEDVPEFVVDRLRHDLRAAEEAPWERLGGDREGPWVLYSRLRRAMIDAERGSLVAARDAGRLPEEEWQRMVRDLDLEDALLVYDARSDADSGRTATRSVDACEHLAEAGSLASREAEGMRPNAVDGCRQCLDEGRHDWVDLRVCLTCGNVGCCDSSPRRHATRHFKDTGHPVMQSYEDGETWRWCYVDDVVG